MNFFTSLEYVNWTRLWWIVTIITTFWALMAAVTVIYPAFDPYYKVANIVLNALSGALLFAARGTKYVTERKEPPADGKP